MKYKIKKLNKEIGNNKNLKSAILQVEQFIVDIRPRNYQDIKIATNNISRAALGAYLSVHSVSETLDFINQIAHSMIEDLSEHSFGNHTNDLKTSVQ